MTTDLRIALRQLRAAPAELRVVAAAVLLSAAAVSAVGVVSQRVDEAMQRQTAEAIGADRVVESRMSAADTLVPVALESGLTTTQVEEFASLVQHGENQTVVGIKAVSDAYPLRGSMLIADGLYEQARATQAVPQPGKIWVDDRLMATLNVERGVSLQIGNVMLEITQVLRLEPDRGGGFLALTPRIMMHRADVAATGLLVPGSRATFRLLLAGEETALDAFAAKVAELGNPDHSILSPRDARPEIQRALQRTERFLTLAVLCTLFLAGAAIALCASGYALRCRREVALLKTLGCSRTRALRIIVLRLVIVAFVAALMGAIAGALIQQVIAGVASKALGIEVVAAQFAAIGMGMGIALTCALGFALPVLLPLAEVTPMQALQEHAVSRRARIWPALGTVLIMLILCSLIFRDLGLVGTGFGGAAITLLLLAGIGMIWVRLLGLLRPRQSAVRHGIAQLNRHRGFSLLQISCLGIGLTAMLMLAFVRDDLMQAWQASLPPDAPNYFMVNVQGDEIPAIEAALAVEKLTIPEFYAMVRARLKTINGATLDVDDIDDPEGQRMLTRAWNLSWTERFPPDNTLLEGEWWSESELDQPLVSIETYLVDALGLKLGDAVEFDIAGETLALTVDSIREVKWDNMRANFFAVTPPAALRDFPATHIAALYIPDNRRDVLPRIGRAFPTVILLDVGAIVEQVRGVMDRASIAIQGVFAFTLAGGILVLLACIQISQAQRRHEIAVLRSLGASNRWIFQSQGVEFLALGTVAGLTAATAAQGVAWALAVLVFDYDYTASLAPWLWGVGLGSVGVAVAGMLGVRHSLTVSPMAALR